MDDPSFLYIKLHAFPSYILKIAFIVLGSRGYGEDDAVLIKRQTLEALTRQDG